MDVSRGESGWVLLLLHYRGVGSSGLLRRGRVSIRYTFYGQDSISVDDEEPPACAGPKCRHSIWVLLHWWLAATQGRLGTEWEI